MTANIPNTEAQVCYLHNFLEPYECFITNLMIKLTPVSSHVTTKSQLDYEILEIVRYSSKADSVFILSNDCERQWHIVSQSNLSEDIEECNTDFVISEFLPKIDFMSVFDSAYHGIYQTYEDAKNTSKVLIVLPLQLPPQAKVMLICGLNMGSSLLEDVYGRILVSFYQASLINPGKSELVEASIIDDLKKDFGFVSSSLAQRRFQLFCQRLEKMVVYFEPVLHLDPDDLFISGWEALARNPESLTAPSDLFQAAELWGLQFLTELDQYFLRVATQSYREARRKAKQNRPQDIAPLSVNVYPESLMQKAYFEAVSQVIKDKLISSRNLILEISEKTELPKFDHGILVGSPLKFFKQRLLKYVDELKIRFAIDDFGVGYASVSRLAGLNPPYVKIDREILAHEPSDIIIRFVRELVSVNNLNPSNIIVEGVEESNRLISLYKLKQIGVSYVQGHFIGKPTPEIYRLTQAKAEELKKLILEPS